MDPVTTQEIGQRLTEMESTLAAIKEGLPFTFMWASALVVGAIELLVWGVGWPVKRFENAADAYLKKKGEHLARKSDLDDVMAEVKETRRVTAQIEQEFSRRKFVSERSYDFAAKAVERLLEPLFVCLEGHERLLASAKAVRQEKDAEPSFTLPKLSESERKELCALCATKHDEFRQARAMAPVVLDEEIVTVLTEYDTSWAKFYSQPWEDWEDNEEGHLSEIVAIERMTYTKLCDAARELLLERPMDRPTPSKVTA